MPWEVVEQTKDYILYKPVGVPGFFFEHYIYYLKDPMTKEPMTKEPTPQQKHEGKLAERLRNLFADTAPFLAARDAHYESSWKRRGGPGAFNTIVRPWDRFEAIAKREGQDIFKILQSEIDKGLDENIDGTLHACIRDLLCYMALLMVEAKQMRKMYQRDRGTPMQAVHHGNDAAFVPAESIKHGSLGETFRVAEHVTKVSLPQRTAEEPKKDWRRRLEDCRLNFKMVSDPDELSNQFFCDAIDNILEILLTIPK